MTFTKTEQEAIVLNAVWSMIDDMVNYTTFMPLEGGTQDINLIPRTEETQRLFHLLLGDFLSPIVRSGKDRLPFDLPEPPGEARPTDLTFLFYLRRVCEERNLNPVTEAILQPVEAFADWLEQDSFINGVWLPSIGVETDLTITRITWLKICADIGKHSFARLERNVGKIVRILSNHGHTIDAETGYAVLPEFWDWFHTHLFGYHVSTIAEFLNNIRWGCYEYLQDEFGRSYRVTSKNPALPMYEFDIPPDIVKPIAKAMYWDLMNMARSQPYFPRFTVTRYLKCRY